MNPFYHRTAFGRVNFHRPGALPHPILRRVILGSVAVAVWLALCSLLAVVALGFFGFFD